MTKLASVSDNIYMHAVCMENCRETFLTLAWFIQPHTPWQLLYDNIWITSLFHGKFIYCCSQSITSTHMHTWAQLFQIPSVCLIHLSVSSRAPLVSDTVCGTMCMCVGCLRLWPWAVVAGAALSTSSACFTQWSTACMQVVWALVRVVVWVHMCSLICTLTLCI